MDGAIGESIIAGPGWCLTGIDPEYWNFRYTKWQLWLPAFAFVVLQAGLVVALIRLREAEGRESLRLGKVGGSQWESDAN